MPTDPTSGEGSLPGSQEAVFWLSPHVAEGPRGLETPFLRALIPSWGLRPHDRLTSHEPLLTPSRGGLGLQHTNSEESGPNSASTAILLNNLWFYS